MAWPSPWPDSSWRPTRPSLGSEQLRGPVHPPALQDPACRLCRGWNDPESCPSLPPSHIPLNYTSMPITPSTSCLLGLPPQVRMNCPLLTLKSHVTNNDVKSDVNSSRLLSTNETPIIIIQFVQIKHSSCHFLYALSVFVKIS